MWGGERTILFVKAGCNVTAVDICDTRKPEFSSGYDFLLVDGKRLPFRDETFEVVVSFDVIEHVDEDLLFLSEAYRVLKRGGTLALGTPNRNRLSHKLRRMLGKKIRYPLKLGEDCIHLREYTMNELVELVKKVGFKISQEEHVWLGLVGIGGFKRFPAFLNKVVQYLLLFAKKL